MPEHELALPRWPARLDGLRVVVVSDLHAGGPRVQVKHLDRIVQRVGAAAPDLVVLVGDYVDPDVLGGRRLEPAAVATRLARIRTPSGTVAVLGNHDWHHEGHAVAAALRHAGIRTLENEAVRLSARGGPLWIAGIGDERERDPRVGSALAAVPEDEPVVVLCHDPDVFGYVPARVALTISGHLHGGQIDLPVLRTRVMPTRHGTRYKEGHVVENGRHLFVSKGVGETGLPIRLGARAELPVLVLREESRANAGKI